MGRVVTPTAFTRAARQVNKAGRRVVFTNGVFDILHFGHVSYLQKARSLGDALFVGVNTDRSTRRLKGDGRPLNSLHDRMHVLAALECVDYVTSFDDDTPAALIIATAPGVLVKGADYKTREIVGADIVKANGGRVARVPLLKGRSTSRLVRKIRQRA
jgi:D-beta-D-heptose 7-phosphate kinase/D-beta-D-heptose 1-phosphate adenosyltransferase